MMTRFDNSPKAARPTFLAPAAEPRQPSVEDMLHEIAYVLHLTVKLDDEIARARKANRRRREKQQMVAC